MNLKSRPKLYQRVLLNLRTLWNKTFHDQATSPHLFDWSEGTTGNMCCPQPGHLPLWRQPRAHSTPISRGLFEFGYTYYSVLTHSYLTLVLSTPNTRPSKAWGATNSEKCSRELRYSFVAFGREVHRNRWGRSSVRSGSNCIHIGGTKREIRRWEGLERGTREEGYE